jgi:hypothetical protein
MPMSVKTTKGGVLPPPAEPQPVQVVVEVTTRPCGGATQFIAVKRQIVVRDGQLVIVGPTKEEVFYEHGTRGLMAEDFQRLR